MKKIFIIVLISLIILFYLIFSPVENCIASGTTIYVDDSGGYDYTTIQAAINAANSGDEIYVYSGTYTENLEISKSITLTGENKDTTIIDGNNNGHVIDVNGERFNEIEFSISGFTIKNAGGTGKDCIALSFANAGVIDGNEIKSSALSDGIQLDHCSGMTISNNLISNNAYGIGISLTVSESNSIDGNTIQNNDKGIYIYYSSNNNHISNNIITINTHYGVHIASQTQSTGNYFYLNDFKNNGQNAVDPHTNYWSYQSQGNKWNDYNNYDSDGDGFGDVPYNIPGGENQDDYPIGYFLSSGGNPGNGNGGEEENNKPVASIFTINPKTSTYGSPVYFSGTGTDPDEDTIEGYSWSSDKDGLLKEEQSFTTSSLSVGTHIISFMVKDSKGLWSDAVTDSVTINPDPSTPSNQAPVADTGGPYSGEVNSSISFDGSKSNDPDNGDSITNYEWDFGDGTKAYTAIVNHKYSSSGEYTVALTVSDSHGEKHTSYTTASISSQSNNGQPNNNEENNETKNDKWVIPGFEFLFVILSLIIIIFIKKRKN